MKFLELKLFIRISILFAVSFGFSGCNSEIEASITQLQNDTQSTQNAIYQNIKNSKENIEKTIKNVETTQQNIQNKIDQANEAMDTINKVID